jgi:multidrug efflux system outer membrane protein
MDLPPESNADYSVFTKEKWWEVFEDKTLNALVERALVRNQDILAAMARVDEARAAAGIVGADRMPTVGYQAQGAATGTDSTSQEDYSASLFASYELDLWGKYRNSSAAARERLLATEAQKDTVRLTLTTDVAKTYFAVCALDTQVAITDQTLKDRQESVRIYTVRYQNGLIDESALKRMQAERDGVTAALAELKMKLSQNETALLVLTGASPSELAENKIARGQKLSEITLTSLVPSEIPSSVLFKRPDVRAAEHALIAANADIGVARAAYFPSLSLTAGTGSASQSLSNLFSGGIWNFSANITGPLFKGGKIKSSVEQMNAKERQAVAAYQKAVQNAFKETYDALNANRLNREVYAAQRSKAEALKRSLELVNKQYESGLVALLDVLDVQRGFLQAQTDEVSAMQAELNAVVAVSKALGGGV